MPDTDNFLTASLNHRSLQVDTDAPVHLVSAGRNGDAVGLRSNWNDQSLQLLHNVKMTYEVPHAK